MAASGSPTVRRRRLAAELRRLRRSRKGSAVAAALGWSPAKISRYELGRTSYPLDEVQKLLDFYGVSDPRRDQLLTLAEDANQRGWWEDYSDALAPEYMEFIGLEAEASSRDEWAIEAVPGLLQTQEYARQIMTIYQAIVPTPPSVLEQRVQVRMIRQEHLIGREPPLHHSVVMDESVLLRRIGEPDLMYAQLQHLAQVAIKWPEIDLRILPLGSENPVVADSFVIFGFDPEDGTGKLGDVVSTEGVQSQLYVEGETDTYLYRLFFKGLTAASLPPDESRALIVRTAETEWTQ